MDARVLFAAQTAFEQGVARPLLLGSRAQISSKAKSVGLGPGFLDKVDVLELENNAKELGNLTRAYQLASPDAARVAIVEGRLKRQPNLAALMLLLNGDVDGAICGGSGSFWSQLKMLLPLIPCSEGASAIYAMTGVLYSGRATFICDTNINLKPSAEQLVEITLLASKEISRLGMSSDVVLAVGGQETAELLTERNMEDAILRLRSLAPNLRICRGWAQTTSELANSGARSSAELIVAPCLDAAKLILKVLTAKLDGSLIGPILLGTACPVQLLHSEVTVQDILTMTGIVARNSNSSNNVKRHEAGVQVGR